MMSVHTVQVLHHKFTVGGPALNSYAGGRGLNTQKLVQDSNLFINLQASMINIQISSDPSEESIPGEESITSEKLISIEGSIPSEESIPGESIRKAKHCRTVDLSCGALPAAGGRTATRPASASQRSPLESASRSSTMPTKDIVRQLPK